MIKFKKYDQNEGLALPPYLDELIDSNHLVRIISQLVDNLSVEMLSTRFRSNKQSQGGNQPYHPKMMLKALIYSYSQGIYTCRKIAQQLRENVHYMWLSGMQRPDFRTINRYRSQYFVDILPQVFTEMLYVLGKHNLIDLNRVFVDGTKIAADANKHKIIWKKNVERYQSQLRERVSKLFAEIESLNLAEMERYGELDFPERGENSDLSSDDLEAVSSRISKLLEIDGRQSKTETGKKLRKAAHQLKEDSKKLKRYEEQTEILSDRNSASKTDHDASVMKMKNEELRPGYNVQSMTDGEFIVGVSVSQNANDGSSFKPLIEDLESNNLPLPKELGADAGYGHEEVFNYLEDKDITAYIKYPSLYAEKSNEAKYRFHYSKFVYDQEHDVFICPLNKELHYCESFEHQTSSGYRTEKRVYRCIDCSNCKFKDVCTQSKEGRSLTVSFKLRCYQEEVKERLSTDYGSSLYRERGFRSETVFGDWKHNRKFRRFHLRGLLKVTAEVILLSLSYNFRKLARIIADLSLFFDHFTRKLWFIWLDIASYEKSKIQIQNYAFFR